MMNFQAKEKTKSLLLGSSSIYITFCIAAVIQQYIIQRTYLNWVTGIHQKMRYSNAFVIIPALIGWVFGMAASAQSKIQKKIPSKNLFYCALLVVLSSLSFTKAIYLSNFPIVMMFKSCHILSVMVVSVFCSRVKEKSEKLNKKQLLSGFIVIFGLLLYYLGGSKEHILLSFHPLAFGLLFFSLVCDGFLPDFQAEIKTVYKPAPLQMFEQINKWTFYISLGFSFMSFELIDMLIFFFEHPLCFLDLILLSTFYAVGQIAVFQMISQFRQHIVPFVLTTRKILTTVISIIIFKHQLYTLQLVGILTIFWAVMLDFYREVTLNQNNSYRQQKQQLVKQELVKLEQEKAKWVKSEEEEQEKKKVKQTQNLIQLQNQTNL